MLVRIGVSALFSQRKYWALAQRAVERARAAQELVGERKADLQSTTAGEFTNARQVFERRRHVQARCWFIKDKQPWHFD